MYSEVAILFKKNAQLKCTTNEKRNLSERNLTVHWVYNIIQRTTLGPKAWGREDEIIFEDYNLHWMLLFIKIKY